MTLVKALSSHLGRKTHGHSISSGTKGRGGKTNSSQRGIRGKQITAMMGIDDDDDTFKFLHNHLFTWSPFHQEIRRKSEIYSSRKDESESQSCVTSITPIAPCTGQREGVKSQLTLVSHSSQRFCANEENAIKCLQSLYTTLITEFWRNCIPGIYCEGPSNECVAENFQLESKQDHLKIFYWTEVPNL